MSWHPAKDLRTLLRCRLARQLVPSAQVITLLFVSVSLCGFASAQVPSNAYTVKGAFIFHFAQLVDWPQDVLSADRPVTFCVEGESAYTTALTAVAQGKQITGHAIQVREVREQDDLRSCHILFISGSDQRRVLGLLARVKDLPILTIGETADFARRGGIIGLCIEENKIRFDINLVAAQQVNLRISSRLLLLARNVIDGKAG
jgi:YfiR/HmsC-like